MSAYRNILVIRTDRIGDVVLTTPALKALRRHNPHARIAVLVSPLTFDLVDGNPDIDEVIVDDRRNRHNGPAGFWRLALKLRHKKFDLAINYHIKKRTNALCFLAGIPERIGYRNDKLGFLLTKGLSDERHFGLRHESQYCLDILKIIGIGTRASELFVPLQEEAEEWGRAFYEEHRLEGRRIIAVHPDASCPTKKWPAHRFIELIKEMKGNYGEAFIIVGSSANKEISGRIMDETRPCVADILDLTGRTSVAQLASILKRCHLLISNDSGPVHIAAGLGTPVVSIFTRNQPGINPERWKPLGPKSKVVAPPPDEGISFAKGAVTDPGYLEIIQVNEVLEAVDALFKLC